MPERNQSILLRANQAVSAGDHEAFLAYCTDDVRWVFVGEMTLAGKDAVREYMRTEYFHPPRFDVEQMIEEGNTVVAIGEIELRNKSDERSRYAYCDIWRIRDGKLAELKAFVSRMDK